MGSNNKRNFISMEKSDYENNLEHDIPRIFEAALGSCVVKDMLTESHMDVYGDLVEIKGISMRITPEMIDGRLNIGMSGSNTALVLDAPESTVNRGDRWRSIEIGGIINASGITYSSIECSRMSPNWNSSELSARGFIETLLSMGDKRITKSLAKTVVEFDKNILDHEYRADFPNAVVHKFHKSGNLSFLLDELSANSAAIGRDAIIRSLNKRVRLLHSRSSEENGALENNRIKAKSMLFELIDGLTEHDLIQTEHLWSIELVSNPKVAACIAATDNLSAIFENMGAPVRREMANKALDDYLQACCEKDDGRNIRNTELIRRVLFNDKTYKRDIPLLEIIKLSNQFTRRLNESRSVEDRLELLPEGGHGTAILQYSGEAIFRVLNMTATKSEHIEENRDIATIFDALMEKDYRQYAKSRPVTVADICARFPDAEGDLVITLHESARANGYSAATKLYKEAKRQYGNFVYYRKHAPGKGIIS